MVRISTRGRAGRPTTRRVGSAIGDAWQLAGDAFRELGREGIEPTAPDAGQTRGDRRRRVPRRARAARADRRERRGLCGDRVRARAGARGRARRKRDPGALLPAGARRPRVRRRRGGPDPEGGSASRPGGRRRTGRRAGSPPAARAGRDRRRAAAGGAIRPRPSAHEQILAHAGAAASRSKFGSFSWLHVRAETWSTQRLAWSPW